jgi:hypothetical protein
MLRCLVVTFGSHTHGIQEHNAVSAIDNLVGANETIKSTPHDHQAMGKEDKQAAKDDLETVKEDKALLVIDHELEKDSAKVTAGAVLGVEVD